MDCTNCAWKTDREACRICAMERREKSEDQKTFDENALKIGLHNATIVLAQWHDGEQN